MAEKLSLKEFLDDYGESLAERVTRDLNVIYHPAENEEEELGRMMDKFTRSPFPAQREIIKAVVKAFQEGNRAIYMAAEMGTGKTLMAIAITALLKNNPRVIVICPSHLVRKWIQEVKETLPKVKTINLNGQNCLQTLKTLRNAPPAQTPEFYIIGKERAKLTYQWRPAVWKKRGRCFCPKCGQELLDKDWVPLPVFAANPQGQFKKKYTCANKVIKWKWDSDLHRHVKDTAVCREPLWQADRAKEKYRKIMPAQYIKDKLKGTFTMLIADECHMFKNQTGQGWAFAALVKACKYTLALTGTLAGGYASDLYYLLFRTHPALMIEDGNKWGNPIKFMEKYGVLERITTISEQDGLTTKARKNVITRARPGISPLLLGKMLLSNSVFMRLADCTDNLAPYEEDVYEIQMEPAQAELYHEFERQMRKALVDALAQGDHSLLGGYLNSLLSYPERIYQGIQVYHPHTKELVAEGPAIPGIMPKERELLDIIVRELAQNRKVLVYIQNSNTTDISPRLVELINESNYRVKVLRAGDSEARADKINKWIGQGLDILICNPKLVEVGLDLLFAVTVVFYQCGYSTYTLRQASRRSWRIPQTRPVKVFFLTYADTMQTRAMKLMADKLTCSLAIEGELTDKGLAALSNTSDSIARELTKMLVEKSEDNRSLKDLWAAYRKKEVQVECHVAEIKPLGMEKKAALEPGIKAVSLEAEQIGDKIVKVEFIEYIGRRKKKVTHVEVTQAELDQLMAESETPAEAQIRLF